MELVKCPLNPLHELRKELLMKHLQFECENRVLLEREKFSAAGRDRPDGKCAIKCICFICSLQFSSVECQLSSHRVVAKFLIPGCCIVTSLGYPYPHLHLYFSESDDGPDESQRKKVKREPEDDDGSSSPDSSVKS